ncbi:histidine phosphatase family protein [Metabacillus niabensis]|uniref:2,3-bisphosphoglycerate-dependent phosphoglycerate mutase n=1 Tax=Metabacillus niabensis TaxID=324854 RepID=A0ABT9Z4Z7_9BACI|nr:histidine phosphatase family protein [Metabacillus niabensis]MDQ0227297.1 2,3-bisphosphoglycerate-dependent phosphoglycerate mutase [Metabacillus niabensis]
MPTNIYLVRHAHSTYTPDELGRPLSAKGLADAERISNILWKEKVDQIISSPYKRAIQTVEGIANFLGKEIILEDGFKERTLSTKPLPEDFQTAIKKVWEDPTFSFEGGESNQIAQKRGITAILKVLVTHEEKNIVVGTHGNIMVLMMNYFDKKYHFNFWQDLEMPDIYRLTFEKKNLKEVKRIWSRA